MIAKKSIALLFLARGAAHGDTGDALPGALYDYQLSTGAAQLKDKSIVERPGSRSRMFIDLGHAALKPILATADELKKAKLPMPDKVERLRQAVRQALPDARSTVRRR